MVKRCTTGEIDWVARRGTALLFWGVPWITVIVTVCDQAAGEVCPLWPGHPAKAHWSIEDPAAITGEHYERRWAFERVYLQLEKRIKAFARLPIASLDRAALASCVERFADDGDAPEGAS